MPSLTFYLIQARQFAESSRHSSSGDRPGTDASSNRIVDGFVIIEHSNNSSITGSTDNCDGSGDGELKAEDSAAQKTLSACELDWSQFFNDIEINNPLFLPPDLAPHYFDAAMIPLSFDVLFDVDASGCNFEKLPLTIYFYQIFSCEKLGFKLPEDAAERVTSQIRDGIADLELPGDVAEKNKAKMQNRFLKIVNEKFTSVPPG